MIAAVVTLNYGDKRRIKAQLGASVNLTITGSPTVTITDSWNGDAVIVSDASVAGFDSVAALAVRVWYLIDTTTLPAPSYYLAAFTIPVTDANGYASTFKVEVGVMVDP